MEHWHWRKRKLRALQLLGSERLVLVILLGLVFSGARLQGFELPAEAQWQVAKSHWDARRWDLAAEEFQIFLDHWPNHPKAAQATFYLAEALLHQGEFARASALYRQLMHWPDEGFSERARAFSLPEPFRPLVCFRLAESVLLANRRDRESLSEARELFERFCQTWSEHPLRPRAWTYLGQIVSRQGDYQEAVRCFRHSLAEGPEDQLADAARFGLAEALEHLGEAEEAERFYFALAYKRSSPFAPQACWRLARLHASQGLLEAAAEDLRYFLKTWPEHSLANSARLTLARFLIGLGRADEVLEVLQPLLEHPVYGPEALYWLGVSYLVGRNVASALEVFELALGREPAGTLANWLRLRKGEGLLQAGRPEEALAELELLCPGVKRGQIPDSLFSEGGSAFGNDLACLAMFGHLALGKSNEAGEIARQLLGLKGVKLSLQTRLAAGKALLACGDAENAKEVLAGFPLPSASQSETAAEGLPRESVVWEARYWLGVAYTQLGNYSAAKREWERLAQEAPGKIRFWALMRLAERANEASEFPEALRWASEAVRAAEQLGERPLLAEALCLQALVYAEMGDISSAHRTVGGLLSLPLEEPLKGELVRKLAHTAMEIGRWNWAAQLLRDLLSSGVLLPCPPELQLDLAWCEIQLERLTEATKRLDGLVRSISEDSEFWPQAWFLLAQTAELMGQTYEALAAYQQVLWTSLPEVEAEARWRAAKLWYQLGEFDLASAWYESVDAYEGSEIPKDELLYLWAGAEKARGSGRHQEILLRLAQNFPSSRYFPEAVLQLAEFAITQKDWGSAKQWLEKLLADCSSASDALRSRAEYLWVWVLLEEGRASEAETAFLKLSEHGHPAELRLGALFGLGESRLRQRKYEEALAAFREYVDQARKGEKVNSPEIARWQALAELRILRILVALGEWEEGYQTGVEWLASSPPSSERAEVNLLVGKCLYRQGKLTQAREFLTQAVAIAVREKAEIGGEAQLLLAECYFLQGDFRSALREYLRLEVLFPRSAWVPAAVLQAAKCYERLGRREEAVRQCRRFLETWPDDPRVSQVRELLQAWENSKLQTVFQSQF
jgi:tetratricopeptide (TPR) repeat protein